MSCNHSRKQQTGEVIDAEVLNSELLSDKVVIVVEIEYICYCGDKHTEYNLGIEEKKKVN